MKASKSSPCVWTVCQRTLLSHKNMESDLTESFAREFAQEKCDNIMIIKAIMLLLKISVSVK